MKKLIVLIVLTSLLPNIFAGNKSKFTQSSNNSYNSVGIIKGKVLDQISGEGLAGVEVILKDEGVKAYTNFKGEFEIGNAKAGAQALIINYIAYESKVINVYINKVETNNVSIKLEEK